MCLCVYTHTRIYLRYIWATWRALVRALKLIWAICRILVLIWAMRYALFCSTLSLSLSLSLSHSLTHSVSVSLCLSLSISLSLCLSVSLSLSLARSLARSSLSLRESKQMTAMNAVLALYCKHNWTSDSADDVQKSVFSKVTRARARALSLSLSRRSQSSQR